MATDPKKKKRAYPRPPAVVVPTFASDNTRAYPQQGSAPDTVGPFTTQNTARASTPAEIYNDKLRTVTQSPAALALRSIPGVDEIFDVPASLAEAAGSMAGGRPGEAGLEALGGVLPFVSGSMLKAAGKGKMPLRYAVLTADNPGGRVMAEGERAIRDAQLAQELKRRGYKFERTVGTDVNAATGQTLKGEEGFLVHGMPAREAQLVGRRFGQTGVMTQDGYYDMANGNFFKSTGVRTGKDVDLAGAHTQVGNRKFQHVLDEQPTPSPVKMLPVPKRANPEAMRLAEDMGANPAATRNVKVDPQVGKQLATVYDALPKVDPEAKAAYDAMHAKVADQLQAIKDAGYKIEYTDTDPYKSSAEMMKDVAENRRLKVFKTPAGGAHPYMNAEQNDAFRAVHDFIAHAGGGHEFGPKGEEGAYQIHAATMDPLARQALATETRGQNSYVNFGPRAHLPPAERGYAPQKAALFPETATGTTVPPMVEISAPERYGHVGRLGGSLRVPEIGGADAVRAYARPGGDVAFVSFARPEQGKMMVNYMGDTAGENAVGLPGVRSLIRQVPEEFPSVRALDNERIGGARHGAASDLGAMNDAGFHIDFKPKIPDPVGSKDPTSVVQAELPYYAGTRTPQASLEQARELAARALSIDGPYGKVLREGRKTKGAMNWYDGRRIYQSGLDAGLPPEQAWQQYNDWVNAMAASTAGSDPVNNLMRATLWDAVRKEGLVTPEQLLADKIGVPAGFGSRFQGTHQHALSRLFDTGSLDLVKNPKPASFGGAGAPNGIGIQNVGNLGLNWNNPTLDNVMSRFMLETEPGLEPFIQKSVSKAGEEMFAPKGTYYGALAAGTRDAAEEALRRGAIDVPHEGLAPTAALQSTGWTGLTGSGEYGDISTIFDNLRSSSAKLWGVAPEEANRLIWRQRQPLMLPLGAPLLRR